MPKRKKQTTRRSSPLIVIILIIALFLGGAYLYDNYFNAPSPISLSEIPEFSGEPCIEINGGVPFFEKDEITDESYESYSELDALGRCGVAMACIGIDIMPTEDEERGDINSVKPAGWVQAQYDCVPGNHYLYHRCHLIGYRLTAENANEKNLITGTEYMNTDPDGMYGYEDMIDDYITANPENHVMYRVTPIYKEKYDLLPWGLLLEGYSVEDNGEGIQFNVFCYNVQPGVVINYFDGTSYLAGETPPLVDGGDDKGEDEADGNSPTTPEDSEITYILNISTKRIHLSTCQHAENMKEENKEETTKSLEELIEDGYTACGTCKPETKEIALGFMPWAIFSYSAYLSVF